MEPNNNPIESPAPTTTPTQPTVTSSPPPQTPPVSGPAMSNLAAPKPSNKKLTLLAVAAVVALGMAAGAYFMLKKSPAKPSGTVSTDSSTKSTTGDAPAAKNVSYKKYDTPCYSLEIPQNFTVTVRNTVCSIQVLDPARTYDGIMPGTIIDIANEHDLNGTNEDAESSMHDTIGRYKNSLDTQDVQDATPITISGQKGYRLFSKVDGKPYMIITALFVRDNNYKNEKNERIDSFSIKTDFDMLVFDNEADADAQVPTQKADIAAYEHALSTLKLK